MFVMKNHLPLYRNPKILTQLFCFGLILFAFGVSWSLFLVSNSVIILSLLMIFNVNEDNSKLNLNKSFLNDLTSVFNTPLLCFMILFFFSALLSGLWSEETKHWIWFTRMKLPFLLLPIVFFIHGKMSMNQWKIIFYVFLATTFFVSLNVFVFYVSNYSELNLLLLEGKPIVSHISHIRFSMILAIAAIISLHYILECKHENSRIEKWILIPLFVYFFFLNHLLSVKTGILGMDLGLIFFISMYFFKRKKYNTLLIALGMMMAMMLIAFLSLPSLQNKFYYTLWQIGEWQRGKWLYYSDIERWVSIQIGIEMIKHNPMLGSGLGDLHQMTAETYQECLNHGDPKLPHNQFIFSWAFSGLPAMISLIGIIYNSIFQRTWIREPMVIGIQIILLTSFLVEYTLGTQIGCSLYVFFTLMSWSYLRKL